MQAEEIELLTKKFINLGGPFPDIVDENGRLQPRFDITFRLATATKILYQINAWPDITKTSMVWSYCRGEGLVVLSLFFETIAELKRLAPESPVFQIQFDAKGKRLN